MTIANASSDLKNRESMTQLGDSNKSQYRAAFTFRPNEHKIVTLGKIRKKYGLFTREEQRKIILNTLNFYEDRHIATYDDVMFEYTDSADLRLCHVHCTFHVPFDNLKIFINHNDLVNKRYSVPAYQAVHHFPVNDDIQYQKWKGYISKIIHPQSIWTAGI